MNDYFSDPLPQPWFQSWDWVNLILTPKLFCSHKLDIFKGPVLQNLPNSFWEGIWNESSRIRVITELLFSSNSVTLCSRDPCHTAGLTSLFCKQHQGPNEFLKEHCLLPVIHTGALFSTQTDRISWRFPKTQGPCHQVASGVGKFTFFQVCLLR